jgi:maltooligosyltrehalose trehalohydrolase
MSSKNREVQSESRRTAERRLPVGAEIQPGGGVHFRVWAPLRRKVEVALLDPVGDSGAACRVVLSPESGGYFSGSLLDVGAGVRYGFFLDGGPHLYPDPASRYQPDGPHGASVVVDPRAYRWQDQDWPGVTLKGLVIYEMHVGTFTHDGTWKAAARELTTLADLGVTSVEVMPVGDFPGRFGWGYDGVNLFAPTRLYGTPDDFREFVDQAHRSGLGVILDVVYNHLGPSGNYLGQFSTDYVSRRHRTAWGDAINFDGENSGPVREYFVANAAYWIDEFHVDGLRLDAVDAILDDSSDHILAAVARRVREAAGGRKTLIFAEDEFQDTRRLRGREQQGGGLDAAWNDDFHHAAQVAMTGRRKCYYADYQGTPQELISAIKWGYLYQGQWNSRQGRRRGWPACDLEAQQFVVFLQNHDQVANSLHGQRAHELTSPGRHRALTALWALAPGTLLLFQGQEFSASSPFLYFADHDAELGQAVFNGRLKDIRRFCGPADSDAEHFADPRELQTFLRSKLDFGDRERHAAACALHRDLFRLRREDPIFSSQRADRIHGAVLAAEAFLLRYFGNEGDDRLLLINLGRDMEWRPASEPLLAPPMEMQWRLMWSSEDPRYGGSGTTPLDARNWYVPGHAATVLRCQADQQR